MEHKIAIVKAGPLLPGTRVLVTEETDEDGFLCTLLSDSKCYKTGDEVNLDRWEFSYE